MCGQPRPPFSPSRFGCGSPSTCDVMWQNRTARSPNSANPSSENRPFSRAAQGGQYANERVKYAKIGFFVRFASARALS